MYVPGDCNILLIYVYDLCYRKKKLMGYLVEFE